MLDTCQFVIIMLYEKKRKYNRIYSELSSILENGINSLYSRKFSHQLILLEFQRERQYSREINRNNAPGIEKLNFRFEFLILRKPLVKFYEKSPKLSILLAELIS